MKTQKTLSTLMATAAMAVLSLSTGFAQSNLGSSCGCPAVASRPTVLLSTLAVSGGANDGDLTATNTILTCDKTYILDKKIYVPDGKTISIAPGTVIKGRAAALPVDASALIVERGGKIFASGSEDCQIVFTAEADPLDGSYGIANRGKWGGVIVLGKATNNLKVGNTFCAGSDGVGFIEGFSAANARDLYGMPTGSQDDNDNSGILKYVSIRHCGAIVSTANEINGLSLGSVGRGTTLEHIEIISSDDDGIEFFGGTVNIKYAAVMFGADDMFDYDLGWTGKGQFLFGIKTDGTTAPSADNGFEADADDNKSNALPRSHPQFYNVTLIGNGNNTSVGDNSGPFAINAKELTEGEFYNSVFANFKSGFNMVKALGTRTGSIEAYNNWINGSLIVSCNTFIANTAGITVDKSAANVLSSDSTKFFGDNNIIAASVPGFDFAYTMNTSTNAVSDQYNAVPKPNLTTSCSAPADGFFITAPFRGAFDVTKKSWLSNWAYAALISVQGGLQPCPTDINADGVTNTIDFLQLVGKFNQSCN